MIRHLDRAGSIVAASKLMKLEDYKQNFLPHDVPDELARLVAFDGKHRRFFSSGFELAVDDKAGLKTYSDDPSFLNCLYPIGQANGSGSTYAIWRQSGALSDAPIVAFGDEGGVHLVAPNITGLLRILTFDAEPMIDWESISYYKSEDAEASDRAAEYVEWLSKNLGLKPVTGAEEVEQIVEHAQKMHAAPFKAWLAQYYAG